MEGQDAFFVDGRNAADIRRDEGEEVAVFRIKVVPRCVEGCWKRTGKPEDIPEANHLILDGIESSNEGKVQDEATVVGRVRIGKETVIFGKSVVRGPAIIGENCKLGPSAYVGPYTAIGDRCQITLAEVDDSITMDETVIDVERKLVRSMVGNDTKILSANGLLPKGERLVVGENTTITFDSESIGT